MSRSRNAVRSKNLTITVSEQSERLLAELSRRGIYGRNAAEVAARFVDEALHRFVDAPRLRVPLTGKGASR